MALHGELPGAVARYACARSWRMAEDAFLLAPSLAWQPRRGDPMQLSLFGVFDGHGGKAAAGLLSSDLQHHLFDALVRA